MPNSPSFREQRVSRPERATSLAATSGDAGTDSALREIERRREVAEALRDLLGVINAGRPVDEILDHVLGQASRLLVSDAGTVYVPEGEDGWLRVRASCGLQPELVVPRLEAATSIAGLVVQQRRPVAVHDFRAVLPRSADTPPEIRCDDRATHLQVVRMANPDPVWLERTKRLAGHYRGVLAVPLAAGASTHGTLTLYYRDPRAFSSEDVELATAFASQTAVAMENARLRAQAEQRARELEALYRADEPLHRSLRLDDVLQALVDVAGEIFGVEKATVMVWDAARDRFVVGAARGFSPESLARMSYAREEGVTGRVASTGRVVAVHDTHLDPYVIREVTDREGIRAVLYAPIKLGGEVFGVFGVAYPGPRTFGAGDERLLLALAQRAALAIENARLYGQAQQAATLEERQRLARELHDAVTQTLFSTALLAEVLPELWQTNPAEGRQRLEELRRLTRGALAEMRTLLVELRPGALTELPLGDLLRQLAEAAAGRARLAVHVTVEGEPTGALPPDVQVALYRVAQEALNNAVKHARARQVHVHLSYMPADGVVVRIEDDGRGFDPAVIPAGHLGVGIMRERADAVGATLRLESGMGEGTRVEVRWLEREGTPT